MDQKPPRRLDLLLHNDIFSKTQTACPAHIERANEQTATDPQAQTAVMSATLTFVSRCGEYDYTSSYDPAAASITCTSPNPLLATPVSFTSGWANQPVAALLPSMPPSSRTGAGLTGDPCTVSIARKLSRIADILGLSNDRIKALTGAHFTTVYRWRRDPKRMPVAIYRLLQFLGFGELDQLGWIDWKILRGLLISPSGQEFTPGEVEAISLRKQQLAEYEKLIRTWEATPQQRTLDLGKDLVKHFECKSGTKAQRAEAERIRRTKERINRDYNKNRGISNIGASAEPADIVLRPENINGRTR